MKRNSVFNALLFSTIMPLAAFGCNDHNGSDENDSDKNSAAQIKVDEALSFNVVDTRAYYNICAEDNYYDFSVRAYSVDFDYNSYPYDEVLISLNRDKAVTVGEYTMPNDANSGYYVTFGRYLDDGDENKLELLSYAGVVTLTKLDLNEVEISIKDIRLKEYSYRSGTTEEVIFNYADKSKIYSIPDMTIKVNELIVDDCADELEPDDDYL